MEIQGKALGLPEIQVRKGYRQGKGLKGTWRVQEGAELFPSAKLM